MLNKKISINNIIYKNNLNNNKLERFFDLNIFLYLVVASNYLNIINILLLKETNSLIINLKEKLVIKKAKYYN